VVDQQGEQVPVLGVDGVVFLLQPGRLGRVIRAQYFLRGLRQLN
jgi:hypothetical protein